MKQNNKNTVIRIVSIIGWIASVILAFYAGMLFHWTTTAELDLSKNYSEITVAENEIVDYSAFVSISEKYGALGQIDESIRKTIALYMQANDLKLAEGTHRFDRVNGTLEKYLTEEFKFEPID